MREADSIQLKSVQDLPKPKAKPKSKLNPKAPGASTKGDRLNTGMDAVYKSLTVLADEVLSKLEGYLAGSLPDGIRSLKPEDHTPEITASRIVDGVAMLFSVFSSQNPKLEGEELISKFMDTVKGGIQTGYQDAMKILGAVGALQFKGVESGIEETMRLVEEKLVKLQENLTTMLLGPKSDEEGEAA